MFSKLTTCIVIGLDAIPISIEVDISQGMPGLSIVGLGDKAVMESRERVLAAIKNSGLKIPRGRITINLAPANIPKSGPSFDFPIAVAILSAAEEINIDPNQLFIGELALNGKLRPVSGILPTVIYAKTKRFKEIFLPKDNANEASIISNINIFPVTTLEEFILHISKTKDIKRYSGSSSILSKIVQDDQVDIMYIKGQVQAKRALEICATGGHNMLLSGTPGSGKTMLARTLPTILPRLSFYESIDVTKIYSVSGLLPKDMPLMMKRPFRTPHHTASSAAIVGGGKTPKPGEISLAHRGVLFLDEFPEFSHAVIESLRQPLEDKVITISRANFSITFPANFTLVAAMNPCRCGWLGDPDKDCICTPRQIIQYQQKISGPILDRIDLQVKVPKIKIDNLQETSLGEKSEEVQKRVIAGRAVQEKRFKDTKIVTNSEMSQKLLLRYCQLDNSSMLLMKKAISNLNLSARSYFRILKVARTIADLANSKKITDAHIHEALMYRIDEF